MKKTLSKIVAAAVSFWGPEGLQNQPPARRDSGQAGMTRGVAVTTKILVITLIFSAIFAANIAVAGTLSKPFVFSPDNGYVSQASAHVVEFTTSTFGNGNPLEKGIPADGKILITYPAGFGLGGVATAVPYDSSIDGTLTPVVGGQTITITRAGGTAVSENKLVKIEISNITNTAVAGNYTIIVETQTSGSVTIDGPTVSSSVEIAAAYVPGAPYSGSGPGTQGVGVNTSVIPTFTLNISPTGLVKTYPVGVGIGQNPPGTNVYSNVGLIITSNANYNIYAELSSNNLVSGGDTIAANPNFSWRASGIAPYPAFSIFGKQAGVGSADQVATGTPTPNLGSPHTVQLKLAIPGGQPTGNYTINVIFTAVTTI